MHGALRNFDLASIFLESVVVSYAAELCVRNILLFHTHKNLGIHIGKSLLGFFIAVKTSFFLSFYTDQGPSCYVIGRFADLFYHLAMVAGDYVLLSRVHAVMPVPWKTASKYSFVVFLLLRFSIGMVDVILLDLGYDSYGMCIFIDNYYTGPFYTFLDLFIDMYVTAMITYILVSHIRRLELAHIPVNITVYVAVVTHNVIRTVMLTVVNLISGVFLIMGMSSELIMLIWPIINLFVVLLIGYDSDVTKTIVQLKEQYWTQVNEILPPTNLANSLLTESLSINANNRPMWKSSPNLPLRNTTSPHRAIHQQQQHGGQK